MDTILPFSIMILIPLAAMAWWLAPGSFFSKDTHVSKTVPRTKFPLTALIPEGPIPDEQFHELIGRLSLPGLQLLYSTEPTNSYLGGMPPADLGASWPIWRGQPLGFLACIHLSDTGDALPWLPRHGRLLFFYDLKKTPWGFDPSDLDGWQVIHLPGDGDGAFSTPPVDLPKDRGIPMRHLRFEKVTLPPTWDHPLIDHLELTESQEEWLDELRQISTGDDDTGHQMGSYPSTIQDSNMEMQCQLVSNGLHLGNSSTYKDPRVDEFKDGASDWRLLLQISSDPCLRLMWGDLGAVYFWVREQDPRSGDFSRTWLILQCH